MQNFNNLSVHMQRTLEDAISDGTELVRMMNEDLAPENFNALTLGQILEQIKQISKDCLARELDPDDETPISKHLSTCIDEYVSRKPIKYEVL